MDFNFRVWLGAGALMVLSSCRGAEGPKAPDGSDAQRLGALVDYLGSDYGGAVQGGKVLSASEYDEQKRFAADAVHLGREVARAASSPNDPLLPKLDELERLVESQAEPAEVSRTALEARALLVQEFHPPESPTLPPSLAGAEASYRDDCAVCHGGTGDADTERAAALVPHPTRFRDKSRLEKLSPLRAYNALTFGVKGTSMPSFELLPPQERWDLAFYVMRLGHDSDEKEEPASPSLAEMASLSDMELLGRFRSEGRSDPEASLSYVRRHGAFGGRSVEAGLESARDLSREALAAFEAGRRSTADRLAIDAYLKGFEPLEATLKARDPSRVEAVEAAFRDFRGAMARGDLRESARQAARLDGLLEEAPPTGHLMVPFSAAALIFFREGIEAALLIGALLAAARKLGRTDAAVYIHAGWITAVPAGFLTWFILDRAVSLGAERRELIEAGVALVAAGVLFSVSFWMISKAESRRWLDALRRQVERGVDRRSLALLAGLSFLALYREAAETILFTQALILESRSRADVWAGALVGSLAVIGVALLMSRAVLKLPLGPFFGVSGVLLCGLAVSFAGSGMHILVASGYVPPRPVAFPAVPWMGIHPDLSGLLLQLVIVGTVAGGGLLTLLRPSSSPSSAPGARS